MFYSTGNNFGAGSIRFKSYQAENHVVLNANFTALTSDAAYEAAEVLEIRVPSLSIDRSVDVAVFVGFRDRRQSYGNANFYDACTLARSWIKDANTVCIEKLACMDGKGKLYFYIAALYPQLNQGSNAGKETKQVISVTGLPDCCKFSSTSFLLVKEHWVFLFLIESATPSALSKVPWHGQMANLPTDVQGVLPFFGGLQQYNNAYTGLQELTLKQGRITCRYRCSQGDNPSVFAFLVRGDNEGEVVDEWPLADEDCRVKARCDRDSESAYEKSGHFSLELGQGLLLAAMEGDLYAAGAGSGNQFTPESYCSFFPGGKYGMVCRTKDGSGLAVYDIFGEVTANNYGVRISPAGVAPADTHLEVFDTSLYVYVS